MNSEWDGDDGHSGGVDGPDADGLDGRQGTARPDVPGAFGAPGFPGDTGAEPVGWLREVGYAEPVSAAALYTMALAIGNSLDLLTMAAEAVDALRRGLGCAAAALYVARDGRLAETPTVALPHDLRRNGAEHCAAELIRRAANASTSPTPTGEPDPTAWQALLSGPHGPLLALDGGYCHLFPLPDTGLLAVECYDAPLAPATVTALAPLLARLAAACRACLHTEHLNAAHQRALLERNMLRALIAGTPTVVFALDPEGRFVVSEGRGLQTLNRTPGEVVGNSIFEVYQDVPQIVEAIRAALAGEQRAITVHLHGRAWDALYTPVIEPSGKVAGVVGVAHDVTDRKAAVDSLSAVLQTVGEGIFSMDAAGTILTANAALGRSFGYAPADLVGRNLATLLPQTPSEWGDRWGDGAVLPALQAMLGQRLELEGRHKNGKSFPVEICVNLLPNDALDPTADRYTGSLRDISERREYDRLRDEFVGTVSHELRTPLASIMGWTETLLTEHPGPLNDAQRRFLGIIYASSQRLNRLIEEILTVSRIQRGTLAIGAEPFHPAVVLAGVRERATSLAEKLQITVQWEDAWPAERTLRGDPQLLEQVITHLLTNAVKFSPPGGIVTVRSQRTHDAWRVEVEDRGMGVPADEIPRLFQRFVRGSNAKSAHTQGAGLGLYVSKAIVEGHGGEIALVSHAGTGTTVWFEVPVQG